MKEVTKPNVLRAGLSIVSSLISVRAPAPDGNETADHTKFAKVLDSLTGDVIGRLPDVIDELGSYLGEMTEIDPDSLTRNDALAYWINVYNAAALALGGRAARDGVATVFGIPGAFTDPVISVAGEKLSLDQIEHAKVRRFKDPRIHAGLVCGAMSCPTLRPEPFGREIDVQLEDQMRRFLADGALRTEGDEVVLSPIFAWFGRDFVSPRRMPTFLPARRRAVLESLRPWLDDAVSGWLVEVGPSIRFSGYDWRLGCSIR
jgi:hypothetical protein